MYNNLLMVKWSWDETMKRAAVVVWVVNIILAIVVAGLWWVRPRQHDTTSGSDRIPYSVQQVYDQLRAAKMYHGNPARRWIALTFDDGPHPYHTPILLRTLRRLKVRATFFVVGRNVDRYPYLVRQMVRDGHEVENHTYNHLRLSRLPLGIVQEEIEAGAAAIWRATGHIPRFVRPPGGMVDHSVRQVVQLDGYVTVMWTADPADYERPDVKTLRQRLFASVRPGSIILLHEKVPQTVEILPEFVQEARRQGYEFVTIEEMWKDMQRSVLQMASYERGGLPSPFFGGSWAYSSDSSANRLRSTSERSFSSYSSMRWSSSRARRITRHASITTTRPPSTHIRMRNTSTGCYLPSVSRPFAHALCAWHNATASASAASSGLGVSARASSLVTMYCICFFSAPP